MPIIFFQLTIEYPLEWQSICKISFGPVVPTQTALNVSSNLLSWVGQAVHSSTKSSKMQREKETG